MIGILALLGASLIIFIIILIACLAALGNIHIGEDE